MEIKEFISDIEELRLDVFLNQNIEELSRTYIQKLIKDGYANVNGRLTRSNYKVQIGDIIRLHIPNTDVPDIIAENIPLDIVYEDEDVLVVNKPKSMVVHPAVGHYTGTLVNALMYYCKDKLSGINGVLRPGIVHRIDKDTTGLLIVCKNDMAHRHIAQQLSARTIARCYKAIVHGIIKEEEGTIDRPIGRHEQDRKKMAINLQNGKTAITHYKVLERFAKASYIECKLETGRSHQIRVHMASLHHPLIGDTVYGFEKENEDLVGQTLHAQLIGFIQPTTGKYLEFEAPLPQYFEELLVKLRRST